MTHCDRSPKDWFTAAEQCYVEQHQGCPWCGGSHRVFRVERGLRREYYCNGCDFRAGHDAATGRFFADPGEEQVSKQPGTMYEI